MSLALNRRAQVHADALVADAAALRGVLRPCESGARIVDLGVETRGGLEAGRRLAEICLAGLGQVRFAPNAAELGGGLAVLVTTDQPIAACMAAQYAGWQVTGEKFFALGSGPMRAAAGREELFDNIGHRETSPVAVGVLESRKFPPPAVVRDMAAKCSVAPEQLTLLVAPTASLAGTVQVVARSVETALHKLLELGGDLTEVVSGAGVAPLPPLAADDLAAIGRTNDAILYGGHVTLWVVGDADRWQTLGDQMPSTASRDHGRPFADIFAQYNHDFYQIDPHLFSPATVTLHHLPTGRTTRHGQLCPEVLERSFGG